MRRVRLYVLLCLMMILTGCNEKRSAQRSSVRELRKVNQEQQRQIEAQSNIMFSMGLVLVMLGGGLALVLAVLYTKRKGGVR